MPKSDSLMLQCSLIYPQTVKKCTNQSENRNFCSNHLIFKCDSNRIIDINLQQTSLEEKTNFLIQRTRRLQNNQLCKHLNKQLSALVKYQQEKINYKCQHPQFINRDLIDNNAHISQEDKLKLFLAPKLTSDQIKQIHTTTGIWRTNLRHFEHSYDSDATDSSSGGESCDELDDYLNELCKQKLDSNLIKPIPLKQKSNWKWALERGSIASRYSWILAQIGDLDFKIRQQNEMYKQFRSSKGQISFYSNEQLTNEQNSCVRTLPLKEMKKRKLVRSVFALTNANRKIARHSTVLCSCNSLPAFSNNCVLCNERYSYIQMIDTDCMPIPERIALLDASYHSVLSLPENVSLGLHFSKLLKKETVQRAIKNTNYKKKKICPTKGEGLTLKFKNEIKPKKKSQAFIQSTKLKKKYEGSKKHQLNLNKKTGNKVKKVRLSKVNKDRYDSSNYSDESSRHDSPLQLTFVNHNNANDVSSSNSVFNRRRRSEHNAYDINNIVIPYSIASTTRVERLQYKEIITPKWRVTEDTEEEEINEMEIENSEKLSSNKLPINKPLLLLNKSSLSLDKSSLSLDKLLYLDKTSPSDESLPLEKTLSLDKITSLEKSLPLDEIASLENTLSLDKSSSQKMGTNESPSINSNNNSSVIDNNSSNDLLNNELKANSILVNNTTINHPKINSISDSTATNLNQDDEDSNLSESTDISDHNSDSLEDLSDEIFIERHLKCEADEKKRFTSYLKNPLGLRGRGAVRQRTESTKSESINLESNTIDGSSQDSFSSNMQINISISAEKAKSPVPDSAISAKFLSNSMVFEDSSNQSTSTNKIRTYSLMSKKDDQVQQQLIEEDHVEVIPYEKRNFPLDDKEFMNLMN